MVAMLPAPCGWWVEVSWHSLFWAPFCLVWSKTIIARRATMNTSALVMMIISIVLLWGGLVLSVIHLAKNPEEPED
ncbi:hypothetical protein CU320_07725 [Acinetobacter pseudolwoffii]|uniref:Methionine/alanine importer small subunit n=1 Tax=Acinetobacter pseudolwoffii TaxID=2053287 RepID=A0A2H9ULP6_9GAMM|nr:hypothetical protein CU320_07725 [Acinetobacter pseudolwoffii]